jgi:hypothetical protein
LYVDLGFTSAFQHGENANLPSVLEKASDRPQHRGGAMAATL